MVQKNDCFVSSSRRGIRRTLFSFQRITPESTTKKHLKSRGRYHFLPNFVVFSTWRVFNASLRRGSTAASCLAYRRQPLLLWFFPADLTAGPSTERAIHRVVRHRPCPIAARGSAFSVEPISEDHGIDWGLSNHLFRSRFISGNVS